MKDYGAWSDKHYKASYGFELADATILALARLVAEKQRLLQLAYETDFLYIMSFDEWLADLPVDRHRPRLPGNHRWREHDARPDA